MRENKKKPWGGRFTGETSSVTEKISASISYDKRLYAQDIRGSVAHTKMLCRIGILTEKERDDIINGLKKIESDITAGSFAFSDSNEDIHMSVESALSDRIGDAGRRLHTARSRNDQVSTDMRLYVRDEAVEIIALIDGLAGLISDIAEKNIDVIMPGYTHMQVGQPVRFSHHLLVYAWQLIRDAGRLKAACESAGNMPLGSGALAGLNYPADREFLREELGFSGIIPNSMDAVSDRDFILDFLYFAAMLGMHLSRMCEELVLWSSAEFAFIKLSDSVTTGSSIMPQKRNPDVAELVRGKTGRLYGNLISLLTVMKGLPLAYNRDFQEDKEPLFDSIDTVKLSLMGVIEMLDGMRVNASRMKEAAAKNFSAATDFADALVAGGLPFRTAHEITGKIVRYCEENSKGLELLTAEEIAVFTDVFKNSPLPAFDPLSSVERKLSPGGTSKGEVEKQIMMMRECLGRGL
jgi:argininosuccinate lyase